MRNQPFQEVQLKFRRAGLFVLSKACLAGLLCAPLVSGQTLSVTVVDPFSDAVTNATVAIGDVEVPTDDSGVAIFPASVTARIRSS